MSNYFLYYKIKGQEVMIVRAKEKEKLTKKEVMEIKRKLKKKHGKNLVYFKYVKRK